MVSIISLRRNVLDFKNLGKIECSIDASSKGSDVIIDAAGAASDAQDFDNSLPKK